MRVEEAVGPLLRSTAALTSMAWLDFPWNPWSPGLLSDRDWRLPVISAKARSSECGAGKGLFNPLIAMETSSTPGPLCGVEAGDEGEGGESVDPWSSDSTALRRFSRDWT